MGVAGAETITGVLDPAPATPEAGGILGASLSAPSQWTVGNRVRLIVLDAQANRLGELPSALISDFEDVLDGVGSCDPVVSMNDPQIATVLRDDGKARAWSRELQVWVNGSLEWWGVLIGASNDWSAGETTLRCRTLGTRMNRRVIGKAQRDDLLPDGYFEAGLRWWSYIGSSAGWSTVTTPTYTGIGQTLKATGSGDGVAAWRYTTKRHSHTYPDGLVYTCQVAVWVDTGATIDRARLATVIVSDWTTGEVYSEETPEIDDDKVKRGGWFELPVEFFVPGNTDVKIEVRLHRPALGDVWFDSAPVLRDEALTAEFPGVSRPVMAQRVIEQSQDPTWGKSSWGWGYDCPDEGGTVYPAYRHSEHANVAQVIDELLVQSGSADWEVGWDGPFSRVFRVYPDGKGSFLPDLPVTLDTAVTVGSESDGERSVTASIVQGDGTGYTRPEGGFTDASDLEGQVLDEVRQAPTGTPRPDLPQIAETVVDSFGDVLTSVSLTVPGAWWWQVGTGDTLPVVLEHGRMRLDVEARVVARKFRPAEWLCELTVAV